MIFIEHVVLVSLLAAFILLLLNKLGAIEWLLIHGVDPFYKLASCNFCLSWWVCLTLSIICAVCGSDLNLVCVAFFATPLTRVLI